MAFGAVAHSSSGTKDLLDETCDDADRTCRALEFKQIKFTKCAYTDIFFGYKTSKKY